MMQVTTVTRSWTLGKRWPKLPQAWRVSGRSIQVDGLHQDIGTLFIHFFKETGPLLAICGQNLEGYFQWFGSQAPKLCVISHKGGHLQKSGRVAGEWAARDGDRIKNKFEMVAEPIKIRFNQ